MSPNKVFIFSTKAIGKSGLFRESNCERKDVSFTLQGGLFDYFFDKDITAAMVWDWWQSLNANWRSAYEEPLALALEGKSAYLPLLLKVAEDSPPRELSACKSQFNDRLVRTFLDFEQGKSALRQYYKQYTNASPWLSYYQLSGKNVFAVPVLAVPDEGTKWVDALIAEFSPDRNVELYLILHDKDLVEHDLMNYHTSIKILSAKEKNNVCTAGWLDNIHIVVFQHTDNKVIDIIKSSNLADLEERIAGIFTDEKIVAASEKEQARAGIIELHDSILANNELSTRSPFEGAGLVKRAEILQHSLKEDDSLKTK